jgi:hypothetical protein
LPDKTEQKSQPGPVNNRYHRHKQPAVSDA